VLIGIENVYGSSFTDVITGTAGANRLFGLDGNDSFRGGAGADYLDGGAGLDMAYYDTSSAAIQVNLATGTASGGDAQGDVLVSIEAISGSSYNDAITGDGGDNIIYGWAGADVLTGGGGYDTFGFHAGHANGDQITDFAGNGADAGDFLVLIGYGTAAQGATFTQVDATHWQINSANNLIHETITFSNGASVHASDLVFV